MLSPVHPDPIKMVSGDTRPPSSQSASFLNKVTIPCLIRKTRTTTKNKTQAPARQGHLLCGGGSSQAHTLSVGCLCSWSQGRTAQSLVCFTISQCGFLLVTRVEKPMPQLLEHALHSVVCSMQLIPELETATPRVASVL